MLGGSCAKPLSIGVTLISVNAESGQVGGQGTQRQGGENRIQPITQKPAQQRAQASATKDGYYRQCVHIPPDNETGGREAQGRYRKCRLPPPVRAWWVGIISHKGGYREECHLRWRV
jgi:hypothetical protein